MTIGSMATRSRRFGSRAAALAGVALALLMAVMAPVLAADPFRDFLESLWPEARGAGRLARHLRRRLPRADAGLFAARSHHRRPQARRQRRPGRVHQVGARVSQSEVPQLARRGGTQVPQGAREGHSQHREEHRCRPLHHGRHLGPRDRLRHAQAAARRHPRAGDAGVHRAAQGRIPPRDPCRPEDAAGGRAARQDARLVGRRRRPDAVHADRVFQAPGRRRRRRQGRHLRLACPTRSRSAARQLANKGWVRGLRWGYEVHMPQGGDCSLEGPPGERTIGEWQKLGFERTGAKPFRPDEASTSAPI